MIGRFGRESGRAARYNRCNDYTNQTSSGRSDDGRRRRDRSGGDRSGLARPAAARLGPAGGDRRSGRALSRWLSSVSTAASRFKRLPSQNKPTRLRRSYHASRLRRTWATCLKSLQAMSTRAAGRAAYEFLTTAAKLAIDGRIDAVTTLPLNKMALHLSGVEHPGHTEILAEYCGVADHAMMLYLETTASDAFKPPAPSARRGTGLGVVHVTLHVALRRVFELLTQQAVLSKIRLADDAMRPLTGGLPPRIAVAALNPHAGEDGLFGDEEETTIRPAVALAVSEGIDVAGPIPNDTLFQHALAGAYDAVVAMYHDQGHIALKTVGFDRAVNVTLGLPIVRTSVAHGTAFDIAWKGLADPSSLIEAVRVAARLVSGRNPG